uniref:Insulin gene enhancer protein ISL-1 n=1 Tax=Cyprinus carpio TaxID=7962 RepID=A0A8C1U2U0_CYPCA
MGDMGDPPKKKRLISLCVGCGNQIHDQYILRVSPDLEWHAACLKCAECNQYLDESCTCFVRDGKTYCKRDYIRAMHRLTLYKISLHLTIFFFFFVFLAAEPISARQPALRPHVHKQPEKTTRVRTVLNEKQLHTLRTCYNANPRPDALMKEQLVEMTGLSPRVIRVWFQNKRCKDKKRSILMKQLQQQQPNDKTNIQGMTGTPMVATSPERHDGGLQANQVEVQSYQPPWKVLSDFALQSDIDQPAFQQLVNFSEGGPGSNSTGSEVASMSSQLPDTPNSMVASPIEA